MFLKSALRSVMKQLLGDYRINWIYASQGAAPTYLPAPENIIVLPLAPSNRATVANSPTLKVRSAGTFADAGLQGYGLFLDGHLESIAHFATVAQYDRNDTWPIAESEAALMNIATEERARGRGYAVILITEATHALCETGVTRLIAFIWWSNHSSVRSFSKAGWRRIGLSVELLLRKKWYRIRLPL
jgi:ribosomal protein S18 acetylase RimI-like enzyme